MTTTDYLINGMLVLLVLRKLRERRLDVHSLVLPLVLVGFAAHNYLHVIPAGGNDLVLIAGLTASGALLGGLAGRFTHVRAGSDGVARARAGWVAAALWVTGIGSRMAFSFLSDHGARHAIAHFSVVNHITGSDAWTAAFVLMALAEVTARLVTLYWRGHRASVAAGPTAVAFA